MTELLKTPENSRRREIRSVEEERAPAFLCEKSLHDWEPRGHSESARWPAMITIFLRKETLCASEQSQLRCVPANLKTGRNLRSLRSEKLATSDGGWRRTLCSPLWWTPRIATEIEETFRVWPDYAGRSHCLLPPLLVSRAYCICEEQQLCIGHNNVNGVWIAARRIEEGESSGAGGLHRQRVKPCQMATVRCTKGWSPIIGHFWKSEQW